MVVKLTAAPQKIYPALENILEEKSPEIPDEWIVTDFGRFSPDKTLWDFQQEALLHAYSVLYLYYGHGYSDKSGKRLMYRLYGEYIDRNILNSLAIKITNFDKDMILTVQRLYGLGEDQNRLDFERFTNRASFWMATGSGKTLIIIKLAEILKGLMDKKLIPHKDILFLTHRDDLINQFLLHIKEFNKDASRRGFRFLPVSLVKYGSIKRTLIRYTDNYPIFYYRSDLLGTEQKKKILDFMNYENNGNWYILLDEAHKGSKGESERQLIYQLMSRNGFLFNFSATFTDDTDIITTAFNYNLERFISEGYGKKVAVFGSTLKAFSKKEGSSVTDRKRVIYRAFILMTYIKKTIKSITEKTGIKKIYHAPMMVILVNSVNIGRKNKFLPDLVKIFGEIEKAARGDMDGFIFNEVKRDLLNRNGKIKTIFGGDRIEFDTDILNGISPSDVSEAIFNTDTPSELEFIISAANRKEAMLKLKSSAKPFGLIKIGDAVRWIMEDLKKQEIIKTYREEENFFEGLENRPYINLLLGSRAFYEGWDSNRPNIIMFINIGKSKDARKFTLQSVGRGIRIEPIKGYRKRLNFIDDPKNEVISVLKKNFNPLLNNFPETLFVMGTDKNVLRDVITALKMEKFPIKRIELDRNPRIRERLFIPVFGISENMPPEPPVGSKPEISEIELGFLRDYVSTVDPAAFAAFNGIEPIFIEYLNDVIKKASKFFVIKNNDKEEISEPDKLLNRILRYICARPLVIEDFKPLEDEIIHFKKIDFIEIKPELYKAVISGIKSGDYIPAGISGIPDNLTVKILNNHYYIPLIMAEDEIARYFRHIIKTKSEIEFINNLEAYLKKHRPDVDIWYFGKIDEYLDAIYIPYFDPKKGRYRMFRPDFIFWIRKKKEYRIVFVDPKSPSFKNYIHKIDGFMGHFTDNNGNMRIFTKHGLNIGCRLLLYNKNIEGIPEPYKKYWTDSISDIFEIRR